MAADYQIETIEKDILIIGAGGAGLRAAIEAHDEGADVAVVGKSLRGKAHTAMAEGGFAAALGDIDPEDSWQQHYIDTMRDGIWINDHRLVEKVCKGATDAIKDLESYGAIFDRTEDGKIMQRAFGGHTYKRTCHIGDRTGLEIMNVLVEQAVNKRQVDIYEEVNITKLFTEDGKVTGALGLDFQKGRFIIFDVKTIISAAGGYAKIYKRTTNPWEITGDGCSMAMMAGAELADMEFVQFHPTGLVHPPSAAGVLVTESVRGEGGKLFNTEGKRFMENYAPEWMELAARDVVARAIYDEIHAGRGTENGGVYLDISHKSASYIKKKLPKMISNIEELTGTDMREEPMEVAPTTHYTMGGIRVEPETMESTTLENFYAAGEVTAQVHGANRLGSNSLTDIIVLGELAGKKAAKRSKELENTGVPTEKVEEEIQKITEILGREGENPLKLKEKCGKIMWDNVGIYRDKDSLEKALKEVEQLEERVEEVGVEGSLKFNPGLLAYLDLRHMTVCAKAVIKSALERDESRGAHQREDCPEKDKKLYNVVCYIEDGKVETGRFETPKPKGKLLELLEDEEESPY
ncbi:MAG: FAD-binding protein [Candidatus Nanohaloarchaea archaeon]|nr:FAD-binding protein [Candidatus Nanohaloarchaea archaeon]